MSSLPSFDECIVVPLSLWEKCKFTNALGKNLSKDAEFLMDSTKPPDVRLKLLQQDKKLIRKQLNNESMDIKQNGESLETPKTKKVELSSPMELSPIAKVITTVTPSPSTSASPSTGVSSKADSHLPSFTDLDHHILTHINIAAQPNMQSILSKLAHFKDQLSYDDTYALTIDGEYYPRSNIIDILRYISGTYKPSTVKDVPYGADAFVKKLRELGIPASWYKFRKPFRSAPVVTRSKQKYAKSKIPIKSKISKKAAYATTSDNADTDDDDDDDDDTFKMGSGVKWISFF